MRVRLIALSDRAGEVLACQMSGRLDFKSMITLKVKKVCENPLTWDFIPKNPGLKKIWGMMSEVEIRDTFLLKLLDGQSDRLKLMDEFRVEKVMSDG